MDKTPANGARLGAATVLVLVALGNIGFGLYRYFAGQEGNMALFTTGLLAAGLAVILLLTGRAKGGA